MGRQASEIDKLPLTRNLSEGGAVGLPDCNEIATVVAPSPRTGALTVVATELLVCLEVVHVDILALVRLIGIAYHGHSRAIGALDNILTCAVLSKPVPSLAIEVAGSLLLCPRRLNLVNTSQ